MELTKVRFTRLFTIQQDVGPELLLHVLPKAMTSAVKNEAISTECSGDDKWCCEHCVFIE